MKRLRHLAVVVSLFFPACSPAVPSPSDEAQVAAYTAEQMACVAEAGAKYEAERCVCQVRVRYGRDCDGGAP